MAVTFKGPIQKTNVGTDYAIGLGYDPGDGNVHMYGYSLTPGNQSAFVEGTNIQDESHLVQVSSPSSTDRFTRYPKISQGDWTHGGRQQIFTDSQAFYSSDGFDTTATGILQASSQPQNLVTQTIGTPSGNNSFPVATDGTSWIIGRYDTGTTHNAILGNNGTPLGSLVSIGAGNPEIYSLLRTPLGIFAGTSNGIYLVDTAAPGASVLWIADVVITTAYYSMAYFNGNLYYIKNADGDIWKIATAAGMATKQSTHPAMEQPFCLLCSTAAGLFYATGNNGQATVPITKVSVLYTDPGSGAVRVGAISASMKACVELNGTTWILAVDDQSAGNGNYTMYSLVGSTISVIDDTRFINPDFQEVAGILPLSAYFKAGLTTDQKYLYIGWQGQHGLRYDPVLNAYSYVGAPAPSDTNQDGRVVLRTSASGIIDVYVNSTAGTFQAKAYRVSPPTSYQGQLVTSYFDFATPAVNKLFLGLDVEFTQPQSTSSLTVNYRTDDQVAFKSTLIAQGPGNFLRAVLPVNTIGVRIQYQIIYNPTHFTANVPWQIRSYSARGELGRVWQMSLACRGNQESYNGVQDPQGQTGLMLYQNLYLARRVGGGDCYVYIYDPTDPDGDQSYVTTVRAHIEDLQRVVAGGTDPSARTTQDGGFDQGADVHLTLVEDLSTT